MPQSSKGIRGIKIALISYSALVILQLIAFYFTNILVLLALALEMLSDVLISSFLLLSVYWSAKPADEIHMFGYKRAQNVAVLIAAVLSISFMGLETFREAIREFFHAPTPIGDQEAVLTLIVILIGMFVVAAPILYILRSKSKGASMKAQLIVLVRDEVSYGVALTAVVLVGQGFYIASPLASMFIAVVIAVGGLYLFKDNVYFLVGKAPHKDVISKIELTAKSVKGVLGVHDLKAEYVGPDIFHASFRIEVARGLPIEEADDIAHEVEKRVVLETDCVHCVVSLRAHGEH